MIYSKKRDNDLNKLKCMLILGFHNIKITKNNHIVNYLSYYLNNISQYTNTFVLYK